MADQEIMRFSAQVRAKDDKTNVITSVTAQTTIGELVRFWQWREKSSNPSKGFLIDLSVLGGERGESASMTAESSKTALKRAADTSPLPDPARNKRSANLKVTAASARANARLNPLDIDDFDEEGLPGVKYEENVKLDPNAGCRIDVLFPSGRRVPTHIIGTNTLEKIGRATCAMAGLEFEKMSFTYDGKIMTPFAHGVKDGKACMMTADEIGLEEGSIIIAHLIPQTESTKSMLPVAKAISDSSAPAASLVKHRTLDSYLLQALPSGPRKNGEPAVLKQPPNAEEDAEFKICVTMSGDREVWFRIRPSTRMEKVCRMACDHWDQKYWGIRFYHQGCIVQYEQTYERGPSRSMLIRDPAMHTTTAADLGLEDGDAIDAILCQCGC